jgi:hypothetical protein
LQVWLVLRGLGLGLTNTSSQNLALSVVNRRDLARGSSLVNVTRQVFIAAGVALMASIVAGRAASHAAAMTASIAAHRPTATAATCLAAGRAGAGACIGNHATVMGLNDAFLVALVACALGVVVALFVGRDPGLEALKGTALPAIEAAFPHLSRPQLVEAATRARTLALQPGQVVIRQGEAADRFYIVKSGAVEVSRITVDGETAELATLGPGDFVGEIGLLENLPRTATVTAAAPTELLAIDAATFAEVVSDAETGASVRRAVSRRLAALP